jgi:hypothetical protein
MNAPTLFIILMAISNQAISCKCVFKSVKENVQSADLVFSGILIEINQKHGYHSFSFTTTRTWKGIPNDVNVILIPEYLDQCGHPEFKLWNEYIIFSSSGETNRCRKNTPTSESYFSGILDFILDSAFRHSVGHDESAFLNQTESEYFNALSPPDSKTSFDFTNKKIVFMENSTLTNKKRYFEKWGDRETLNEFVLLTNEEKKRSGGYDAFIVSWRKKLVTRGFKRRTIKKLGMTP